MCSVRLFDLEVDCEIVLIRTEQGPAPVIRKIKERHAKLNGNDYNATMADDDSDTDMDGNFISNEAISRMLHPSLCNNPKITSKFTIVNGIPFPLTPPATPDEAEKVTTETIIRSPHGTITGGCHRLQCLGYIVKVVTAERDPKGWYLECTRKDDKFRPCNYRRDSDGNVTQPLPRVIRRPPPRKAVPQTGEAGKGSTPSTPAGKGGAVSKQTPESHTAGLESAHLHTSHG